MSSIFAILLALALSVPVGMATVALGALVWEFVLGTLLEAGEAIVSDPQKKRAATVIAIVLLLAACLGCFICIGGAFWVVRFWRNGSIGMGAMRFDHFTMCAILKMPQVNYALQSVVML